MEECTDGSWSSPHTHIVIQQEMGSSAKIQHHVNIIKEIISLWLILPQLQSQYFLLFFTLHKGGRKTIHGLSSQKRQIHGLERQILGIPSRTDALKSALIFFFFYTQDFLAWEGRLKPSPSAGKSLFLNSENGNHENLLQLQQKEKKSTKNILCMLGFQGSNMPLQICGGVLSSDNSRACYHRKAFLQWLVVVSSCFSIKICKCICCCIVIVLQNKIACHLTHSFRLFLPLI